MLSDRVGWNVIEERIGMVEWSDLGKQADVKR